MSDNIFSNKSFLKYFFTLYIANLAAVSASNTMFLATISLDLLGANKTYSAFIVGLPRYMIIIFSLINFFLPYKRLNKQTTVKIGSILGIISFIGMSFSHGYITLVLFCMVYGIAYMIAMTYITSMLLDYTPSVNRMSVLGIFTTSSSLGSLGGPFLTQIILSVVMEYTDPHTLTSLSWWGMFSPFDILTQMNPNLMFLAGVIYYLFVGYFLSRAQKISKKLDPVVSQTSQAPIQQHQSKRFFSGYSGILFMPIIFGGIWMVFLTFIPILDHNLNINASNWYFFGFAIVGLVGRIILSPYLGIWKVSFIIQFGFYLYVVEFLIVILFYFWHLWWLLLLAGCLQGLAHGILYPSLNVLFTRQTPDNTARATNVFIVVFQIGCFIVVPLGLIIDYFGFLPMFITIGIIVLVSYIACYTSPMFKQAILIKT